MLARRRLGRSEITVAPLAFGGNVFGWSVDEAASLRLLDAFVAQGFNLIDTADVYSRWVPGHRGGESETIIGHWMRRRANRDQVVIATKVGMDMGAGQKGLSARHIVQAAEASLRRLQTDYIDLYQSHADDPEAPLDETLAAYDQLIKAGKVRAIGASNYSAARLAQALEWSDRASLPAYVALQPHYNLYDRAGFERELESLCLAKGLGVITYFSLASGFLSGKYRSEADLGKSAARGSRVAPYLNERGWRILKALDTAAEAHRAAPAAIALAWLMHRQSVTAPIASATSLEQLADLMKAADIRLSLSDLAALDVASAY